MPDGIELGITTVDTLGEALLLVPLGVVVAFVGIPALGLLGRGYGELAALLLGSNPDPELSAQVTSSRAPARASSPPPTPSAGASSATSTTARNSAWSRCR